MNFRVTFLTTEQALGGMLAHFSRSQLKGVEIVPIETRAAPTTDAVPVSTGSGHSRIPGKALLMQTGTQEGQPATSLLIRLLRLHEKLEAKVGIGTVTRSMFAIAAKKSVSKFPSPGINRLVDDGWLTIVGVEGDGERD